METIFEFDIGDNPIAAVRDPVTRRIVDYGGVPFIQLYPYINLQKHYFNSGVLLIDIKNWNQSKIEETCIDYLNKSKGLRRFPDQDALNIACYDNWFRLNKRWNHTLSDRLDIVGNNRLYEAILIHLNDIVKPWRSNFPDGYRKKIYQKYAIKIANKRKEYDNMLIFSRLGLGAS